MKNYKILLTLLILFLSTGMLNAQNPLSLSWEGEPIYDTLYVHGSMYDFEMIARAVVTNNTDNGLNIKVLRQELYMQEGSQSYFCWGLCYPPTIDESPASVFLGAGESSAEEDFSGHYTPEESWGTSVVRYTFFDENDDNINVSVVVLYAATTTSLEENQENALLVYPNPSRGQLYLQGDEKLIHVSIFNSMGARVFSKDFENVKLLKLNAEDLESGIYTMRIQAGEKIFSKQLIILE